MLESRSRTDVREVAIEAPREEAGARAHYQRLLDSPLYDRETDRWRTDKWRTDETLTQLLGVLTEAQFDRKSAIDRLHRLYDSDLYDAWNGRWMQPARSERWMQPKPSYESQKLESLHFYPQIIAAVATSLEDPARAAAMLASIDIDQAHRGNCRGMAAWAYAQTFLDPAQARLGLEQLRSTSRPWVHYDPNTGLFHEKDANPFYTDLHLLHIIVTARIEGPARARWHYEQLKGSAGYDETSALWTSLGGREEGRGRAIDQLLAVIAEAEIERGGGARKDAAGEIPALLHITE